MRINPDPISALVIHTTVGLTYILVVDHSKHPNTCRMQFSFLPVYILYTTGKKNKLQKPEKAKEVSNCLNSYYIYQTIKGTRQCSVVFC